MADYAEIPFNPLGSPGNQVMSRWFQSGGNDNDACTTIDTEVPGCEEGACDPYCTANSPIQFECWSPPDYWVTAAEGKKRVLWYRSL